MTVLSNNMNGQIEEKHGLKDLNPDGVALEEDEKYFVTIKCEPYDEVVGRHSEARVKGQQGMTLNDAVLLKRTLSAHHAMLKREAKMRGVTVSELLRTMKKLRQAAHQGVDSGDQEETTWAGGPA